ncbi:MAG: PAS domain S-box protein [Thermodesulfobacteriota bacterium]
MTPHAPRQQPSTNPTTAIAGMERRLAELEERKEEYQRIIDAAREAVVILQNGGVVFANPGIERITGFRFEEVAGRPFLDFIHPDDREEAGHRYRERLQGKAVATSFRLRGMHKDGRIVWADVHASLIEWHGAPASLVFFTDVTERVLAEEALRQIADTTPDMIHLVKPDAATFFFVNPATERLLGYGAEELLGRPVVDIVHPDDRETVRRDIARDAALLASPATVQPERPALLPLEIRLRKKDGSFLDVEVRGFACRGDRRTNSFIGAVVRDISARKAQERQLAAYRDDLERLVASRTLHLERLLDFSRRLVASQDPDVLYRTTVRTAMELLGFHSAMLLLREEEGAADLFRIVDHAGDLCALPAGTTMVATGGIGRDIFQGRRPAACCDRGGDPFCPCNDRSSCSVLGVPLLIADDVFGMLIGCGDDGRQYEDETVALLQSLANQAAVAIQNARRHAALQQAAAKIQKIFDQASDAIIVTGLDDLRINQCNRMASTLTGIDTAALHGRDITELFTVADRDKIVGVWRKFYTDTSSPRTIHNVDILQAGGASVPVEINAATVDIGGRSMILNIIRDLSDRRRMEEEILRGQKLESIGVLAGGIAHDFNNLLTIFTGNLSLLRMRSKVSDSIDKHLSFMENACSRARDLTNQLLTFSKGGAPLKEAADLGSLIRDSASFSLSGANVSCSFDLPADLWPAEVDLGQFSRVIHNLTINAVHAMPRGGTLRIAAGNRRLGDDEIADLAAGDYVEIRVRDEGIGIPGKYLDRIFDPYFSTKTSGSGLGLAASHSIMRRHDGHIRVESTPGAGTTFFLYLPAATASRPRRSDRHRQPVLTGSGAVLVMDDEECIRDLLDNLLRQLGYSPTLTRDGAEAVAAYGERLRAGTPFSAVILDLTIPGGMGGKDTAAAILAMDPRARLIASSGYSQDDVMANHPAYGFAGAIAKPYEIATLARALAESSQTARA